MAFTYRNGYLYCEQLRVRELIDHIGRTPFYLYSRTRLEKNFAAYASLEREDDIVAYAVKANGNLGILRELVAMGAGAVLVSGGELALARAAGVAPERTIFNGNGKTFEELKQAAAYGSLINIDSEFDLAHIEAVGGGLGRRINALIRVNPDIAPDVHPYVATGVRDSKFGIDRDRVADFFDRIKQARHVDLVGVHCHLGSTINDIAVYHEAATAMLEVLRAARASGFDARYVNIGGGLGIDAAGRAASDLMHSLHTVVGDEAALIVEPGRSIVGDAGIFVCRVIGVKETHERRFIVADGSMAEFIRPSLYNAHHTIAFVEPVAGPLDRFDVVGPVCESGDFLGRERQLAAPHEGAGVAVFEAGAYGYAMSSNYNARLRPAEYLVDGDRWTCIRRAEEPDDLMRLFPES